MRRDVDGNAIGEGRFHRGILQEICMWCMMIAGVVYESSKSRWGFEFCDGMALSFATLNSWIIAPPGSNSDALSRDNSKPLFFLSA